MPPINTRNNPNNNQAELFCSQETQAELTWIRSFWNDSSSTKFWWQKWNTGGNQWLELAIVLHLPAVISSLQFRELQSGYSKLRYKVRICKPVDNAWNVLRISSMAHGNRSDKFRVRLTINDRCQRTFLSSSKASALTNHCPDAQASLSDRHCAAQHSREWQRPMRARCCTAAAATRTS
jgi:hypothetical protein